jgi:hypothetical protein
MQLVTQILNAVAWPAAVIILALVFRSAITSQIANLKRIRARQFELEFRRTNAKTHELLREEQSALEAVASPATAEAEMQPGGPDATVETGHVDNDGAIPESLPSSSRVPWASSRESWQDLLDICLLDPRYAVHIAGEYLDDAIRSAGRVDWPASSLTATRLLVEGQHITPRMGQIVLDLQRFRNLSDGNPLEPIAIDVARDYIDNVRQVVEILEPSNPP